MSTIQSFKQTVEDIFQSGSVNEKNMIITVFFAEACKLTQVIKQEGAAIRSMSKLKKHIKKAERVADNEEEVSALQDQYQKAKSDEYSFADKRAVLKNLENSQSQLKSALKRKVKQK